MGCFFAYEPEIPGVFGGVGVSNAHFVNASRQRRTNNGDHVSPLINECVLLW